MSCERLCVKTKILKVKVSCLCEGDTYGNTAMFQEVLDGKIWAHVGGKKQDVDPKCGHEVVQARNGTTCGGVVL